MDNRIYILIFASIVNLVPESSTPVWIGLKRTKGQWIWNDDSMLKVNSHQWNANKDGQ
jgi:hypothetical protein